VPYPKLDTRIISLRPGVFVPKRERKLHKAVENSTVKNVIIRTLRQYYEDDKMKEDEMGGTCSTHGRSEKCLQSFCQKT
jgi:hypothetical protein